MTHIWYTYTHTYRHKYEDRKYIQKILMVILRGTMRYLEWGLSLLKIS